MYNHEPPDYNCPFCKVAAGLEDEASYTVASDIVLRTNLVIGFISSHWWPRNPGHVILIPWDHYENIYDLPETCGTEIYRASREIALAMKAAYGCDGISTRQHNEPAGMQEVWHFHLHVFPALPRRWFVRPHTRTIPDDAFAAPALRRKVAGGAI